MKKNLCLLILALGLMTTQAEKLKVVASFLPLYAHTKSIVGDLAEVEQLLDRGTGPHDFQFTPRDVKKIAAADLLIVNGLGLEEWMGKLIQQAGNKKLVVVDTSKGIRPLQSPEELEVSAEHGHSHAGHNHGTGANPHIWLDPVIAQKQVVAILGALVKADAKNAATYQKNAATYQAALQQLHQDFQTQLSGLNPKNLITFHDAFPYLAARYQLKYLGFIEEFPEKAPSPKQLAALVDLIKSHRVKVIFAEEGYEPKLLRTLAEQTGAVVATLDTLEVGAPEAAAYLQRMRANLTSLQKAWK